MNEPALADWSQSTLREARSVVVDERGSALPSGTVTFLLTDVERSTQLWDTAPDVAATAIRRQHGLIGKVVAEYGGVRPEEQGEGDSVVAVFGSAGDAVTAALEVQRALLAEAGSEQLAPRVRIGLHTGEARLRDPRNYTGIALHRCARLRDVAHGGQTLLSSVTAAIVADALPAGTWLRDLGDHRLRDLSRTERVFELRHADLVEEFPPLRSLDVLANNLPTQLTSFVGRASELAEVERLVGVERLVTLTGSGGCGKTRLALQVSATLADRWPDGVWWIDLGAVTEPARVAELTASTIGVLVDPVGGPLRALAAYLRDRRQLVCLDNCEHLVEASGELADTLLRACPEVSVLATSREPLGVAGETVWRVPSLVEDEAVSLFVERGALARPGFAVGIGNEEAVRTVCRRLDGIPLAVELAAAWLPALTPVQIAHELDDRFRLLAGGSRGAVARQQTLAASVEWSHDLLDDDDRAVFRQLAVHAGGFTLDAARAVCAEQDSDDTLGALRRLVDKSLVLVDERDGHARYRLLETIRQYAQDRLQAAGEIAAIRDRHLDHFVALAETAEPQLEDADQDRWLARLETEHDNLRSALAWGLSSHDPERGCRLAATLPQLWLRHGHAAEGTQWLRQALDLAPDERSTLRAKLLAGAALVAGIGGQFPLTLELAQRGVEAATASGDDRHRGRCLGMLAYVQFYLDFTAARELGEESQRYAEKAGDAFGADFGLTIEALALTISNRHDEAVPLHRKALERGRRRGDRMVASFALIGLANAELLSGHVPEAVRLADEAQHLAAPLGDYFTVGTIISQRAWVLGIAGKIDDGLRLMDTVVRSVEDAGSDIYVPPMMVSLGLLCLWGGKLQDAIEHLERGARHGEPLLDNLIVARSLPGLAAAKRQLGHLDEAGELADRAITLAKDLDAPVLLAASLDESAFLTAPEDPETAEDVHHEALAVRVAHGLRTFYVDSLDALAGLAVRAESFAEAARLLAASDAARQQTGYPRPPVRQPDHATTLDALQTSLGADGLRDAWSEGAALTLDEAVAYATRARGARQRPSSGWASLTPTERDVVGLSSEGLTNPEIGGRLFMSRETVKTHLSHIYAKLGVANRTELAAHAATHASPERRA